MVGGGASVSGGAPQHFGSGRGSGGRGSARAFARKAEKAEIASHASQSSASMFLLFLFHIGSFVCEAEASA